MELERHEATPNLRIFFGRLLELKEYIHTQSQEHENSTVREAMLEVYERFKVILKESK